MTVRSSRDKLGQGPPATVSLRSRTVVLSEMAIAVLPVTRPRSGLSRSDFVPWHS
jgi:hypothetical protein